MKRWTLLLSFLVPIAFVGCDSDTDLETTRTEIDRDDDVDLENDEYAVRGDDDPNALSRSGRLADTTVTPHTMTPGTRAYDPNAHDPNRMDRDHADNRMDRDYTDNRSNLSDTRTGTATTRDPYGTDRRVDETQSEIKSDLYGDKRDDLTQRGTDDTWRSDTRTDRDLTQDARPADITHVKQMVQQSTRSLEQTLSRIDTRLSEREEGDLELIRKDLDSIRALLMEIEVAYANGDSERAHAKAQALDEAVKRLEREIKEDDMAQSQVKPRR